MSRPATHRPSPALVVASLALFVALAGTGYAAVKLPANSVGRAQLQKDAVTTSKVKDGSLKRADFARGQVPAGMRGAQGAPGIQGPKGDIGPRGLQGMTGPAGATNAVVRFSDARPDSNHVSCPSSETATGGGADSTDGFIDSSVPITDANGKATGWMATAAQADGTTASVGVWVVCVRP